MSGMLVVVIRPLGIWAVKDVDVDVDINIKKRLVVRLSESSSLSRIGSLILLHPFSPIITSGAV